MGSYWYMVYSSQGTKNEPAVVQYFYAQTLEELKGIAVENGQFPTFVPHEGWLDGVSFYAGKTAAMIQIVIFGDGVRHVKDRKPQVPKVGQEHWSLID